MCDAVMRACRAVALTLVLAACTTNPAVPAPSQVVAAQGGDLTSAIGPRIPTLDPSQSVSTGSIEQVLMVFEPLLRFDPVTSRPIPGAAAALPVVTPDGLHYRVTLRNDLLYSDGVSVRAQDFAYSLSRLCDPAERAPYASLAFQIVGCTEWHRMKATEPPAALAAGRHRLLTEGLRVRSERELEIVLREPAAYFVAILGLWVAVPIREYDVERGGRSWWADPATYVGNGPFKLKAFTPDERIVFERNPRARVPAKLASWTKLLLDSSKWVDSYRAGTSDLVRIPGAAAALKTVDEDALLRRDLRKVTVPCTTYVALNTIRPPLDDVNVRLALAKSVDRDVFVRDMQPPKQAATTFIPPGSPGHDASDDVQRFDPAAARQLLARSRYPAAQLTMTFEYVKDDNAGPARIAPWLAGEWKRNLGIDVAMREVAPSEYVKGFPREESRPSFILGGWCQDYPDQQNWLSTIFASDNTLGPFLGTVYHNDEVDGLLYKADRERDPAARDALYLRASRAISADAVWIWLAFNVNAFLVRPTIRDLYEGGSAWPELVWVDKG
jgi:oligopeptide transport system substrate-binding protein